MDGYELGYQIEGTGIPSLVIGSSVFYPRVFSEHIRQHLQLIFVDHRGFAEPPGRKIAESEYALDTIVEDIEKIRKQLRLDIPVMLTPVPEILTP